MSIVTDLFQKITKQVGRSEVQEIPMTERQTVRHDRIRIELGSMELSPSYHSDSVRMFEDYVTYLEDIATRPYSKEHEHRTLTEAQEDHLDKLVADAIKEKNPAWVALRDYRGTNSRQGTPFRWAQNAADGYWKEIHPNSKIGFCPDPVQDFGSRHPGTGRMRVRQEMFDPKDPAIAFKIDLMHGAMNGDLLNELESTNTYFVEHDLLPRGKMNFSMDSSSRSTSDIYKSCPEKLAAAGRLYTPPVRGDIIRDSWVLKAMKECTNEELIQKYVDEFKAIRAEEKDGHPYTDRLNRELEKDAKKDRDREAEAEPSDRIQSLE